MTENTIVIRNMSDVTRRAITSLMEKNKRLYSSIENCLATLMTYRMQLKAAGKLAILERLDTIFHLKDVQIIYLLPKNT